MSIKLFNEKFYHLRRINNNLGFLQNLDNLILDAKLNELPSIIEYAITKAKIARENSNKLCEIINKEREDLISRLAPLYLNNAKQVFPLPHEMEELIERYRDTSNNKALFTNIPIKFYEAFLKHFRGQRYRYRFRGKSLKELGFKRPPSHCTRTFALSFSIYEGAKNA